MTIHIATVESRHFTFSAIGTTAAAAKGHLIRGLEKHGKSNRLATDWFADLIDDITIEKMTEGETVIR